MEGFIKEEMEDERLCMGLGAKDALTVVSTSGPNGVLDCYWTPPDREEGHTVVSTRGPGGVLEHVGPVGVDLSPPPDCENAHKALVGRESPHCGVMHVGVTGIEIPGEGRDGCFEPPSGLGPVCCTLLNPLQNFCAGLAPETEKFLAGASPEEHDLATESAKFPSGASLLPPETA